MLGWCNGSHEGLKIPCPKQACEFESHPEHNEKFYVIFFVHAPIAQLVEQTPLKRKVLGSNPSGRTRMKKSPGMEIFSYVCETERDRARRGEKRILGASQDL